MASKLTPDMAAAIRSGIADGFSRAQLATAYHVCRETINRIARGESWANTLPQGEKKPPSEGG